MMHVMSKKEIQEFNEKVEAWWKGLDEDDRWGIYQFMKRYLKNGGKE